MAAQQTNKAFEATSSATQQYVSKAQGYMGANKKAAVDQGLVSKQTANTMPGAPVDKVNTVNTSTFPTAPKTEPLPSQPITTEPPYTAPTYVSSQ